MIHSERETRDAEAIRGILEKSDACHLALNDGEYPYIVTMSYGYEFDGETITLYFHCARRGKKLDAMDADGHAAFSMDCDHEYIRYAPHMHCTVDFESIVGRGILSRVTDEGEYDRAIGLLLAHYGSEHGFTMTHGHRDATCVLKLVSRDFTGKKKKTIPEAAR